MTFEDFLPKLERDLSSLSPKHRLAFGAACCERAFLNLEDYGRASDRIDTSAVRQTLDEVWEFLESRRQQLHVAVLREACEAQMPPEHDNHILAAAAGDAVQMVDLLLEQVIDSRPRLSREIAGWAQASIDNYLQVGPSRMQDLSVIQSSDLMQRELERQKGDLEWLKLNPTLDGATLAEFRARATVRGSSLAQH